MELSSRNTFIYLPRIFYGILYFIYKGSKLGMTFRRKPPLARLWSDAPPLSAGFIAKVQFIVEIIPRRTHARTETDNYIFLAVWPWAVPSTAALVFAECLLRRVHFVRSRGFEKRDVIGIGMHAWHRSARRTKRRSSGTSGREKKKCRCAKEGNGTHGKGDKLHRRHGFIRARYVTVIRDATRHESTSSRYFWTTTPLSFDRQCVFSRFDEGINGGGDGGGWKSPGWERNKRDEESERGGGGGGGGGEREREKKRETTRQTDRQVDR